MHKITIDESHNDIRHLGLRAQCIAKPYLDILVIAETSRHGKHYGKYWNDGKQSGISECRGIVHYTFGGEELHGKHHLLQHFETEIL